MLERISQQFPVKGSDAVHIGIFDCEILGNLAPEGSTAGTKAVWRFFSH